MMLNIQQKIFIKKRNFFFPLFIIASTVIAERMDDVS